MSLFKCKMCGGSLEVNAGESVVTCEYCGTQQTLPKLDDNKRANMYDENAGNTQVVYMRNATAIFCAFGQ